MTLEKSKILALKNTKAGGIKIKSLISKTSSVELISLESSIISFEKRVIKLIPDAIFVEYNIENTEILELFDRLRQSGYCGMIILLSSIKEPDIIIQFLRAGVGEFIYDEPDAEKIFLDAVTKIKKISQTDETEKCGKFIGFMGVKGGVGTSHISVNTSWALSQIFEEKVALVDLDLNTSNDSLLLDIQPKKHLKHVSMNFDKLNLTLMENFLTEAEPGLSLLAGSEDPIDVDEIKAEHISSALDLLNKNHSVVVMDIGCNINDISLSAMDMSDKIYLIMDPTVPGLKNGIKIISICEKLGYEREKIMPVVSGYNRKGALKPKEISKTLNRDDIFWLPEEGKFLTEAENSGQPVIKNNPNCKWAKSICKLGKQINKIQNELNITRI